MLESGTSLAEVKSPHLRSTYFGPECADEVGGDVGDGDGLAEGLEGDEFELALADFFVAAHGSEEGIEGKRFAQANGKLIAGDKGADAFNFCRPDVSKFFRQAGGKDESDADGFAVEVVSVSGHCFDGVPEGMPQIEEGPPTAGGILLFVGGDNRGFDGTVGAHNIGQLRMFRRKRCIQIFDTIKKCSIRQQAMLDHLSHAGGKLARWQASQQGDIDKNRYRLMKGTDQIFAGLKIDSRLSTDGAIDHGKKCRRDLIKIDSTEEGSSGKPCKVTGHATANGEEGASPVNAVFGQKVAAAFQFLKTLRTFPGRDGVARKCSEGGLQKSVLMALDLGIDQHCGLAAIGL